MPKRHAVKIADYHLIDIVACLSHGGFRDLDAARLAAREAHLAAWQIYRGNTRVEHHAPDGLAVRAAADLMLPAAYHPDPLLAQTEQGFAAAFGKSETRR